MDKSLDGRVGPDNTSMDARAPSGGKAPGASAEHQSPPVMHLEDHHIAKLFGKKMPPIGSKIKVHGLIHVGAYNEDKAKRIRAAGRPRAAKVTPSARWHCTSTRWT